MTSNNNFPSQSCHFWGPTFHWAEVRSFWSWPLHNTMNLVAWWTTPVGSLEAGCGPKRTTDASDATNEVNKSGFFRGNRQPFVSFFFLVSRLLNHQLKRFPHHNNNNNNNNHQRCDRRTNFPGWCQFELTVNVLMGGHAPVIMVQGLGSVLWPKQGRKKTGFFEVEKVSSCNNGILLKNRFLCGKSIKKYQYWNME